MSLPLEWRSSAFSAAIVKITVVAASLLIGGCATLSPNGSIDSLQQPTQEMLGATLQPIRDDADARAVAERIAPLLKQPLTADSAVQIALLNRRALQAELAELGIADAERVQLTRLDNPRFGFKHMSDGEVVNIERTLGINLLKLFNQPLLQRLGAAQFEAARQRVLGEIVNTATETRLAWVDAVAAEQTRNYAQQVSAAAEAGSLLAADMRRAGNWSELAAAREALFQSDALALSLRARQEATVARERLARQLGLASADALLLPAHLPALPTSAAAVIDIAALEQRALDQRLDIAAARAQLALTAENLGLTRRTRVINVLDLGLVRDSTTGQSTARGYEIGIEIPLFDWGEARVAAAEATYLREAHRLAQRVIDARSEVRESQSALTGTYALAAHYRDVTLPQRKRIADENLLRYNGMLIGVFELLADAREQVAVVDAANTALRDYWRAEVALHKALGGPITPLPPGGGGVGEKGVINSPSPRPSPIEGEGETTEHEEHRHE